MLFSNPNDYDDADGDGDDDGDDDDDADGDDDGDDDDDWRKRKRRPADCCKPLIVDSRAGNPRGNQECEVKSRDQLSFWDDF